MRFASLLVLILPWVANAEPWTTFRECLIDRVEVTVRPESNPDLYYMKVWVKDCQNADQRMLWVLGSDFTTAGLSFFTSSVQSAQITKTRVTLRASPYNAESDQLFARGLEMILR